MKIFFVRLDKLLETTDMTSFKPVFKSQKRNVEYQLGRFITKYLAKKVYNLKNTDIITVDNKPVFKSEKLCFSISHSDNIVGVAFSRSDVGLDIEKNKPRNLTKLSNYFKKEFSTSEMFYQYWTEYESKYKCKNVSDNRSFYFENYYFSVSASSKTDEFYLYELVPSSKTNKLCDLSQVEFVITKISPQSFRIIK